MPSPYKGRGGRRSTDEALKQGEAAPIAGLAKDAVAPKEPVPAKDPKDAGPAKDAKESVPAKEAAPLNMDFALDGLHRQ